MHTLEEFYFESTASLKKLKIHLRKGALVRAIPLKKK